MKRKIAAACVLVLVTAGCPQKPQPFCPNNTCETAPPVTTSHSDVIR
jgi:hypothetical protein